MAHINYNLSDDYDEYDSYYQEILSEKEEGIRRKGMKGPKKAKEKFKGHQSKHGGRLEEWEPLENTQDLLDVRPITLANTTNRQEKKFFNNKPLNNKNNENQQNQTEPKQFIPGPNSHEIKGNMIDFDRVADIQKIENEYNGRNTYGIKFLFMGKKGLSRVIWFNQNIRERDRIFEEETSYWSSIKNN